MAEGQGKVLGVEGIKTRFTGKVTWGKITWYRSWDESCLLCQCWYDRFGRFICVLPREVALHEGKLLLIKRWMKTKITLKSKMKMTEPWCSRYDIEVTEKKPKGGRLGFPCDSSILGFQPLKGRMFVWCKKYPETNIESHIEFSIVGRLQNQECSVKAIGDNYK